MNITVRNVKAEKTVNLAYPINNLDSSREIAIVSVFSDNVTYEITKPLELTLEIGGKGKAKKLYRKNIHLERIKRIFVRERKS